MKEIEYHENWIIQFSLLISITTIISGIAYYFQLNYFEDNIDAISDDWGLKYNLIRALRMFIFYVIPSFVFVYRRNGSWKDFGLLPKKGMILVNVILGIAVYLIAAYVFIKYEIFFLGWKFIPINIVILKFMLIALMASITDFWTRGFILYELSRKYNDRIAILGQNALWFVIHIYEILLLEPFIGLFASILLTLFLGISGDMIALKTKSIFGLMLGHSILNLVIIIFAREFVI